MIGTHSEVTNWLYAQDRDKLYEIKQYSEKRTNNQNRLLWHYIGEIAKIEGQDDLDIYCQALEAANCKYTWLMAVEEAANELKKVFRVVKLERYVEENGKQFAIFKCFIGSSKMNKKEFSALVDVILRWCYELNIPVTEEFEI